MTTLGVDENSTVEEEVLILPRTWGPAPEHHVRDVAFQGKVQIKIVRIFLSDIKDFEYCCNSRR